MVSVCGEVAYRALVCSVLKFAYPLLKLLYFGSALSHVTSCKIKHLLRPRPGTTWQVLSLQDLR
jgi:hypothetical protein